MGTIREKTLNASRYTKVTNGGPNSGKVMTKFLGGDDGYVPLAQNRNYTSASPIPGYGGIISLERSIIRKSASGGTVDVYIGRWMGNSGRVTVTWDMVDGSRTIANSVVDYPDIYKAFTFEDGEYGWKRVQIPLQTWTLTDWDHIVFRITDVTIDGAIEFYSDKVRTCYIKIDDESVINSNRLFVDKDHVSASDANAGTASAPFLTLQKLSDEMTAQNKSGYVVAASTPYEELYDSSGGNRSGWTIDRTTGGANYNDFLKLDGLTSTGSRVTNLADRPIVSTNHQESISGKATLALQIYNGSSIWVTDFVMKDCINGFQITSLDTQKIIAERIESYGHVGVNDRSNIAGFKFDNAVDCVIHNCSTHDCYSTKLNSAKNYYSDPVLTNGTYNGIAVYSWTSGVQSYGSERTVVEYCEIYNCESGVYGKEQRYFGGTLEQSMSVRNNNFRYLGSMCYEPDSQGELKPAPQNAIFAFNTSYYAATAVRCANSSSPDQGEGLYIFNNTLQNTGEAFNNQTSIGMRVVDNIAWGLNEFTPTGDLGHTMQVLGGSPSRFLDYSESNTYDPGMSFNIYRYDPEEVNVTSLAAWKTIRTDNPTVASNYMDTNPDQTSDTIDPQLTDPVNGDFSRPLATTDSIYGETARGAIVDSEIVVGSY